MALFLDTETTGLSPSKGDTLVEIAIVDAAGRTVIDTLVNPGQPIPPRASAVHGITDDMVRGYPTLSQLMPRIRQIVTNQTIVIYNSNFDAPFFPGGLQEAKAIECAMRRFATATGAPRSQKLDFAARHVGHQWTGAAHRALADALACRSVWCWLETSGRTETDDGPLVQKFRPQSGLSAAIVPCPQCSTRLRVVAGKLLDISCPQCKHRFRHRT
jgi:DNA polymerase III epsilon subunit-like protein